MNWNKAIKQIEEAIANNDWVGIEYHRKWMKHSTRIMKVDTVISYEWKGQTCKGVTLYDRGECDMIDEGSHIIDTVMVDSFFNTHDGSERR